MGPGKLLGDRPTFCIWVIAVAYGCLSLSKVNTFSFYICGVYFMQVKSQWSWFTHTHNLGRRLRPVKEFSDFAKVALLPSRGVRTGSPPSCIFGVNNKSISFCQQNSICRLFLLVGWQFMTFGKDNKWLCGPLFPFSPQVLVYCSIFMGNHLFPRTYQNSLLSGQTFSSTRGLAFPFWDPTALASLFYYSS